MLIKTKGENMIKSNGTPISSEPMKVNTKRLNDLGLIVDELDNLKDNKQRLFEKDDVENELFKGGK